MFDAVLSWSSSFKGFFLSCRCTYSSCASRSIEVVNFQNVERTEDWKLHLFSRVHHFMKSGWVGHFFRPKKSPSCNTSKDLILEMVWQANEGRCFLMSYTSFAYWKSRLFRGCLK